MPGRGRGGLHHGHHRRGRDHRVPDAAVPHQLLHSGADEDAAGGAHHHLSGCAGAGADRARPPGPGGSDGLGQEPRPGDRPAGGGHQRRLPLRHVPGRRREQAGGTAGAGGPVSGYG